MPPPLVVMLPPENLTVDVAAVTGGAPGAADGDGAGGAGSARAAGTAPTADALGDDPGCRAACGEDVSRSVRDRDIATGPGAAGLAADLDRDVLVELDAIGERDREQPRRAAAVATTTADAVGEDAVGSIALGLNRAAVADGHGPAVAAGAAIATDADLKVEAVLPPGGRNSGLNV